MSTYIYPGIITALTSISHIGETRGIYSLLRREKIIGSDLSSFEEIPIYSGNAWRGLLRDLGMLNMCRVLGYNPKIQDNGEIEIPGLSLPAFYFLFSGGVLTKEAGKALDIDAARKMRKLIPLISVFGSAVGNMMLDGKLLISKLIPICAETAHLLPEHIVERFKKNTQSVSYVLRPGALTAEMVALAVFDDTNACDLIADYRVRDGSVWIALKNSTGNETYDMRIGENVIANVLHTKGYLDAIEVVSVNDENKLLSIWNMLQLEAYVRKDDEKNEYLRLLLDREERKRLEQKNATQIKAAMKNSKENSDTEIGKHQQMRYFVETFAMGTQFYAEIILKEPTDIEYEAFMITLAEFARLPYLGGKSGTGHGKVKMQFNDWMEINPNLALHGQAIAKPIGKLYETHLQDRGEEIRELLAEIK